MPFPIPDLPGEGTGSRENMHTVLPMGINGIWSIFGKNKCGKFFVQNVYGKGCLIEDELEPSANGST